MINSQHCNNYAQAKKRYKQQQDSNESEQLVPSNFESHQNINMKQINHQNAQSVERIHVDTN